MRGLVLAGRERRPTEIAGRGDPIVREAAREAEIREDFPGVVRVGGAALEVVVRSSGDDWVEDTGSLAGRGIEDGGGVEIAGLEADAGDGGMVFGLEDVAGLGGVSLELGLVPDVHRCGEWILGRVDEGDDLAGGEILDPLAVLQAAGEEQGVGTRGPFVMESREEDGFLGVAGPVVGAGLGKVGVLEQVAALELLVLRKEQDGILGG